MLEGNIWNEMKILEKCVHQSVSQLGSTAEISSEAHAMRFDDDGDDDAAP